MKMTEQEMWRVIKLIEKDLNNVDKEVDKILMILDDNIDKPILVEHAEYSLLCIRRRLSDHANTLNKFQEELFKYTLKKTKDSTGLEKLDLYFKTKTLKVDLKKKIKEIENKKL